MKKALLFFLFMAVQTVLFAQERQYVPFVEEGKTWYMNYSNEEVPEYPDYDYCYYIQGDTVIGGIECKKFYAFNYNNAQETEYLLALFENDRKVYFIPKNMENSHVLYDFDNTKGGIVSVTDAIHTDWEREMKMVEERILNIGLESRRCVLMQPMWEERPTETSSGWWIEGIGSEIGPLNTWLFRAAGNNRYFQKCVINEKVIIDMEDFKSLSSGVLPVHHIEKNCPSNIFSVSGVKIKNGHGIYIQDKKKVLKQ
jgi:hypothetical protein